mmetsp:Transcript_9633/g.26654  ORF Transcript_9633/g.26654 Transcript_9633/m.26654 type:complete len:95 (+) Transcript_9633:2369-2653(+)
MVEKDGREHSSAMMLERRADWKKSRSTVEIDQPKLKLASTKSCVLEEERYTGVHIPNNAKNGSIRPRWRNRQQGMPFRGVAGRMIHLFSFAVRL